MIEQLDRSVLLGTILLAISGCASSPIGARSQLMSAPLADPKAAAMAEYPPYQEAVVVLPHSDQWSSLVEYVAPELTTVVTGFVCDLIVPSSPKPGLWRLAGISSVYYTPILDIYADRRKQGAKNELVYYHFWLGNDAK